MYPRRSDCAAWAAKRMRVLASEAGWTSPTSTHLDKLSEATCEAWRENHARKVAGQVTCATTQRGQHHGQLEGFLNVGVSKQLGALGSALSPFNVVAPPEFQAFATSDGSRSGLPLPMRPLELVWQSAKVKPSEVTDQGYASPAFFERRRRIFEKGVVKRRYYDLKQEGVAGSVFEWGPVVPRDWITSRAFYASAYLQAVKDSAAFKFLRLLHQDGLNMQLMGPDGYAMTSTGFSPSQREIEDVYVATDKPFGHERVLVSALLGMKPWERQVPFWSQASSATSSMSAPVASAKKRPRPSDEVLPHPVESIAKRFARVLKGAPAPIDLLSEDEPSSDFVGAIDNHRRQADLAGALAAIGAFPSTTTFDAAIEEGKLVEIDTFQSGGCRMSAALAKKVLARAGSQQDIKKLFRALSTKMCCPGISYIAGQPSSPTVLANTQRSKLHYAHLLPDGKPSGTFPFWTPVSRVSRSPDAEQLRRAMQLLHEGAPVRSLKCGDGWLTWSAATATYGKAEPEAFEGELGPVLAYVLPDGSITRNMQLGRLLNYVKPLFQAYSDALTRHDPTGAAVRGLEALGGSNVIIRHPRLARSVYKIRGCPWLFQVSGTTVRQVGGGVTLLPHALPLSELTVKDFFVRGAPLTETQLEEPIIVLMWLLGVRRVTLEDEAFFRTLASSE